MAIYTCKWCGGQHSNPSTLTIGLCHKSPHKKHELMNATEKLSEYVCKYCGGKHITPSTLVTGFCHNSPHPNKAHELLG